MKVTTDMHLLAYQISKVEKGVTGKELSAIMKIPRTTADDIIVWLKLNNLKRRTEMKVEITLIGCDDTTRIVEEVDEEQLAFLEKISALTRAESSYSCMPVLMVSNLDEGFKSRR